MKRWKVLKYLYLTPPLTETDTNGKPLDNLHLSTAKRLARMARNEHAKKYNGLSDKGGRIGLTWWETISYYA